MLQRLFRDPLYGVYWILRRLYNVYQEIALRRTARIGEKVRIFVHAVWTNQARDQLRIGSHCILGKVIFHIHEKGRLRIGAYSALSGVRIECAERVEIGEYCQLSYNVEIHDNNSHPISPRARRDQIIGIHSDQARFGSIYLAESAEVIIGNNVWVGHDVIILKGVQIGDNAVIAAGSVVVKDIPPNTIAAGNPAHVVKDISDDQYWSGKADAEQ